jgi:fucose permease
MFKMKEIEANALAKQMESQGKHQQRMTEQVNDAEANISQSNAAAEADLVKTEYKTAAKLQELVAKAELESKLKQQEREDSDNDD